MENISESRYPDYQVVIVVDYDDGRMFPITNEDTPKCLLPIANKRLLAYQLDMLVKSGVIETFIVAPSEYGQQLSKFISETVRGPMLVELILVPEMMGSADALRAVSERIRGDFICISSDVISQFPLGELAYIHRLNTSDVTIMLSVASKDKKDKDLIEQVDQEYIAITNDGRIVMKTPTLEIDEFVTLSKGLLHRCSNLNLRNDIIDLGIYVMSFWVLEFLNENANKFSSIRSDLIPYLINRQFQNASYLLNTIPALEHRNRPMNAIESWLVNPPNTHGYNTFKELSDQIKLLNENKPESDSQDHLDLDFSNDKTDLLRCFGVVYDTESMKEKDASASTMSAAGAVLMRLMNVQGYLNINRDLPVLSGGTRSVPWSRVNGYQKKEMSTIGESCDISTKSVTIKQCSIGNNTIV
eukprot:gene17546-24348_t